jgi:CO/xanthine dehydrogenase FAD-binding subunit
VIDVLADPAAAIGRGLITQVRVPRPAAGCQGGADRVTRTPSDQPIVAAAALVTPRGIRIALGGVAPQPLLIQLGGDADLEQVVTAAVADLNPPADFRGSAGYRRAMAPVVARRAVAQARA